MTFKVNSKYAGMTMNEVLCSARINDQFDAALSNKEFEGAVQLLVGAEIFSSEEAKEYVDRLFFNRERFVVDKSKPFKPPSSDCIMNFVKEVNKMGVHISFPRDVNFLPEIPEGLFSAIVNSLLGCNDDEQQWIMIHYFEWVKDILDGKPIIEIYEKAQPNGRTRFHITEMLNSRQVSGLDDWIIKVLNRDGISENDLGLLPLVSARLSDSELTRQTLRGAFNKSPVRVAMALGICGTVEDADFLQSRITEFKSWELMKMRDAITSITSRAGNDRK